MTYRGKCCWVLTILYQTMWTNFSSDSWLAARLSRHWIFIGSTSQSMFGSSSILIALSSVSCKYCRKNTLSFYASASDQYRQKHCVLGLLVTMSVHTSVRARVRPETFVSKISYKPMDGISLNFGWRCSWGDRWTDYVLKVASSRSRSLQG